MVNDAGMNGRGIKSVNQKIRKISKISRKFRILGAARGPKGIWDGFASPSQKFKSRADTDFLDRSKVGGMLFHRFRVDYRYFRRCIHEAELI